MPLPKKQDQATREPLAKPHLYREDETKDAQDNLFHLRPLFPQPHPAARMACRWGGLFFLFLGGLGFFSRDLMQAHLTDTHNYIHLISGVVLVLVGLKGSPAAVRTSSLLFGSLYGLLGIVGLIFGQRGVPSVPSTEFENRLLVISSGNLELGTSDHIFHLVIGIMFLYAGMRSFRRHYQAWT